MEDKQTVTGYPSIDKPWLKYYNEKNVEFDNNLSIYQNFKRIAEQKPHKLAFIDYKTGVKVTYFELLNKVDSFANGLTKLGMTIKNTIGVLSFNSIIDPVALLGANKIGATLVFVNPDGGPEEIYQSVQYLDALILENIFVELEPIINKDKIPVIVYGDGSHLINSNYLKYEDFIAQGVPCTEYTPQNDMPSLVIFSSGSTGAPKPIVHSNRTVNASIEKMLYSDFPLNDDNFLIKAIPSHIGLGVITTMLVGLLSGTPYIQLNGMPNPATGLIEETFELIHDYNVWLEKYDFNKNMGLLLFAAPYFAKYFLSRIDDFNDLSMLKGILLGGAKMLKEELDIMDKEFAKKGLQIPVCNGYGQNEMGGAVALNTVHYNKNGSAGYPVYNTNVKIVDRNTHEELPYNTVGQILEMSDSKFIQYMGMEDKTLASKIILSDGTEWYDSTDLGYMDEDGFIYITGRTTRVVIKTDHKVSLDVVENKIKNIQGVVDVAVVPYLNNPEDGDTIAFVVLNNEINEISIDILKDSKYNLTVFELPVKLVVVEELPRMNNGKVDYRALEEKTRQI